MDSKFNLVLQSMFVEEGRIQNQSNALGSKSTKTCQIGNVFRTPKYLSVVLLIHENAFTSSKIVKRNRLVVLKLLLTSLQVQPG